MRRSAKPLYAHRPASQADGPRTRALSRESSTLPVIRPESMPSAEITSYNPAGLETVAHEAHFIFTSDVRRAIPTNGDRHPSGEQDRRGNGHSPGTQRIAREPRYP